MALFLEIAGVTREPGSAGSGGENYLAQKKLYDQSRHENTVLDPIVCAARINMRNMCEMAREVNVWCNVGPGEEPLRATFPEEVMHLATAGAMSMFDTTKEWDTVVRQSRHYYFDSFTKLVDWNVLSEVEHEQIASVRRL